MRNEFQHKTLVESHRVEGRIGPIFGDSRGTPLFQQWKRPAGSSFLPSITTHSRIVARDYAKYARLDRGFYFVSSNLPAHAGFEIPLFGEGFFDIHFCLTGRLQLSGRWGEVSFEGPRLLFWYHPPGHTDVIEHVVGSEKGYSGVSLYCDQEWLEEQTLHSDPTISSIWNEYTQASQTKPQYRVLSLPSESNFIIQSIQSMNHTDSLSFIQLKGRAYELFSLAFAAHLSAQTNDIPFKFKTTELEKVAQIFDLINLTYTSPLSIGDMSRSVGLNSTRLMQCFKLHYGETIRGMITRLRMEKARQLLLTTDLKVSAIALEVGYAHHSTFTAAFVKYFGTSPKDTLPPKPV